MSQESEPNFDREMEAELVPTGSLTWFAPGSALGFVWSPGDADIQIWAVDRREGGVLLAPVGLQISTEPAPEIGHEGVEFNQDAFVKHVKSFLGFPELPETGAGYQTSEAAMSAAIGTSQTWDMRDPTGKAQYEDRVRRLLDAAGPVIWNEALAAKAAPMQWKEGDKVEVCGHPDHQMAPVIERFGETGDVVHTLDDAFVHVRLRRGETVRLHVDQIRLAS